MAGRGALAYPDEVTTAVCPGSFDPLTLGHVDVVRRARSMFDEVVVGVARNSSKSSLLPVEERVALARDAFADVDGVRVEAVDGLLADFVRTVGAVAVVKGLRGGADFDAELPMALMNRHLSGVETVFVVGDPALAHIASSLVKDVARYGGPIDDLVPRAGRGRGACSTARRGRRMTDEDPTTRPEGLTGVLDAIASAVANARAMPMSSSVLVNRAELLDLVDQARDVLPTQLTRADEVLADADAARVGRPGGRRRAAGAGARAGGGARRPGGRRGRGAGARGPGGRRGARRPPSGCSGTPTTTATAGWRTSRSTSARCSSQVQAGRAKLAGRLGVDEG